MADATDSKMNATPKARKATPRKTTASKAAPNKAPARKSTTKASAAGEPTFAQSAEHARAAFSTASAATRAKVDAVKGKAKSAKSSAEEFDWRAQSEELKTQASKMAYDVAGNAKVKTGTAMQGLSQLISETAQTVDTKLGPQYGDYARRAATAVAEAANSLDQKDVDQLIDDAREFVRKSPAVTIGAAAIAGYVLMRLARGPADKD